MSRTNPINEKNVEKRIGRQRAPVISLETIRAESDTLFFFCHLLLHRLLLFYRFFSFAYAYVFPRTEAKNHTLTETDWRERIAGKRWREERNEGRARR